MELNFFLDVSPAWWIKARRDESFLKKYVFEKFERDYYPRIIESGREKIDLDTSGLSIKKNVLEVLKTGHFDYEFFPEDENLKESYLISNGHVNFHPKKTKTNSCLLIRVEIPNA